MASGGDEPGVLALEVTSANWLDAPYNRLGFRRVGELVRTAPIPRGDGPVLELPRAERDLGGFVFEHGGRSLDIETMLQDTYTDGFLVLHDGSVAYERYLNGMAPSETHLLMSVSKSFNATLCGVLAGTGALRPGDLVTDHVEELRGTAWEGCTRAAPPRHARRRALGLRPRRVHDPRRLRLPSARPDGHPAGHGDLDPHRRVEPRARAARSRTTRSRTTCSAGCSRGSAAQPYPELFSRAVWSRLGAEHDAEIMLDHTGFPIVEGGFCATLRDLARFGLMWLQDGSLAGREIVPREWVARLSVRDQELIDAYGTHGDLGGPTPDAFYHDNWWIWDAERGVYAAVGMNGQGIFVHRPSRTVIAKLSTFPDALDAELFALHDAGMSRSVNRSLEALRAGASGDAGEQEGARLAQHLARHDEALDLLGALVDLRDLRVPHHALDRILLHVPVPAEDLNRVGRDLHRRIAAEELRHRRGLRQLGTVDAVVDQPTDGVRRPRPASQAVSMSASMAATSWCSPIGRPIVSRVRAYSSA